MWGSERESLFKPRLQHARIIQRQHLIDHKHTGWEQIEMTLPLLPYTQTARQLPPSDLTWSVGRRSTNRLDSKPDDTFSLTQHYLICWLLVSFGMCLFHVPNQASAYEFNKHAIFIRHKSNLLAKLCAPRASGGWMFVLTFISIKLGWWCGGAEGHSYSYCWQGHNHWIPIVQFIGLVAWGPVEGFKRESILIGMVTIHLW